MSEVYTPSTVEVMTAWVEMRCGYDSETTRREARAEFNRWLAARDATRGTRKAAGGMPWNQSKPNPYESEEE